MIVNKCSEILLAKSKKLYGNYRDNCTVVQRMLEKYKKLYPNISDYSIMHFIDIAEFCDMIMDKRKLENLNEDECYCLLSAALFAHIGFGLNQEIMNRYVDKLGIQKQAEELTFFQVMSKYHVLFSACLLEEYGVHTDGRAGITVTEYIYNMDECIAACDMLISRSGAITLAELTCLGKPAILIPSPNVTENHQYHNALSFVSENAGLIWTGDEGTDILVSSLLRLRTMGGKGRGRGLYGQGNIICENLWSAVWSR